jgi:uracil-DNA glycosylase
MVNYSYSVLGGAIMKTKEMLYEELCQEIKKCTMCQNIQFTPYLKNSDCFVHAKNSEEVYVNLWNRWQHSLYAEIMIIGQDYGFYNEENFRTDSNIKKMFEKVFGINIDEPNELLFFTNIANCYRKNKSTGILNKGCLALCANKFMSRLIRIVEPKIIIVLGKSTFEALACCDNARIICNNPVENNVGSKFKDIMGFDYELQFEDGSKITVFPVYHLGANGMRNRTEQEQLQDWERIFNYAEKIGLKISKFKGKKHLVNHHNMFAPSCEVESIAKADDFLIYCYRENRVCEPKCDGCLYWTSDEMGVGKCCTWEEYYCDVFKSDHIVQYSESHKEFDRVNKLRIKKDLTNNLNNYIITECNVSVYLEGKYIMTLGAGVSTVIRFSDLADKGILEALRTERSFACNREVCMTGKSLLNFISKEYPEKMIQATENISDLDAIYKIFCYDIS